MNMSYDETSSTVLQSHNHIKTLQSVENNLDSLNNFDSAHSTALLETFPSLKYELEDALANENFVDDLERNKAENQVDILEENEPNDSVENLISIDDDIEKEKITVTEDDFSDDLGRNKAENRVDILEENKPNTSLENIISIDEDDIEEESFKVTKESSQTDISNNLPATILTQDQICVITSEHKTCDASIHEISEDHNILIFKSGSISPILNNKISHNDRQKPAQIRHRKRTDTSESIEYDEPYVENQNSDDTDGTDDDYDRMHNSNNTIVNENSVDLSELRLTESEKYLITARRFNPFDREVVFNDEHFSGSEEVSRINQNGSKSSSGSSFSTMSLTEIEHDVTYAELGLAEDYFSRPEGHFGMTGVEELEMAIDNCKELINETSPHSEKRKNLVKKLVQLRLKVQELKEGDLPQETDIRTVVGHKFLIKESRSSRHYCEKCNGLIWGVIQWWYKCTECGYCSHDKCLNLITRTCASVKVQENPAFILSICPEKGLAAQGYRCAECRLSVGHMGKGREPRLCDYTGNYYCDLCHWNDGMVIPARVTHNWDFELRKVCRASKQLLRLLFEKSILRIQDINPMLFNYVEELHKVKKIREEFLIMKKYFLCCKKALEEKLLLQLKGRQHFVDNSDMYSLKDLFDINNENLIPELETIHTSFTRHITQDCQLCRVKGFICEICNSTEVLFPFDDMSIACSRCSYVVHRNCFIKGGNHCPRCDRREKRIDT